MASEEHERLARLGTLRQRYTKAMHACQSAIAYELGKGDVKQIEPKHLRVGVNSALIDSSSLAKLLIDKEIITEEEYYLAMAEAAERELAEYERKHAPLKFG